MLIVTGHSGSGKSTLAISLAAALPSRVIEMGDIVRSQHAAEKSATSLVDFADEQFRKRGPPYFVAQASALLGPGSLNIVVGIRRPEEFWFLSRLDRSAHMLWLEVPRDLRETRKLASSDAQYQRKRTGIEVSWGIKDLPALADLVLDGSRPTAELTRGILQWLFQRSSARSDRQPPTPTRGAA
jgi:adenylate kinase family enzyme